MQIRINKIAAFVPEKEGVVYNPESEKTELRVIPEHQVETWQIYLPCNQPGMGATTGGKPVASQEFCIGEAPVSQLPPGYFSLFMDGRVSAEDLKKLPVGASLIIEANISGIWRCANDNKMKLETKVG